VSLTRTSSVQAPGQLLLITLRVKVNEFPQALPEAMFAVRVLAAPEMEPLPVIDQE